LFAWAVAALLLLSLSSSTGFAMSWGGKELDTEKVAVQFAREVDRGGYRFLSTVELKSWLDRKKAMPIVDTIRVECFGRPGTVPENKEGVAAATATP